MPTNPVNPANGDRYILLGRVVPMGGREVIPNGAVYLEGNKIVEVLAASQPAPTGFEKAARIDTEGTLYPGLIELHNHLSYNAMPLWDVPQKYTNNSQWKRHADYQCKITKPSQVLGRSNQVAQALVRFVECRALLGGVTTSQGITLAGADSIRKYYRGIVRNVEQPGDEAMKAAGTHIADAEPGKAREYLQKLKKNSCYLQHLSEGTDDRARQLFENLKIADNEWAITDVLCGIHSAALNAQQLSILRNHGGSIVWSPLSNYLLYGDTLGIENVGDTLIGLGSDWAPSGSKNLLGELKVAFLVSKERSNVFTPEQLVKMVTENPAKILKWQDHVGSLAAGHLADLVCVQGTPTDPYLQLIEARETDLALVVIDGVPRIGLPKLMARFAGDVEAFKIDRENRQLNLADAASEAVVGKLPLSKAIETLTVAMQHLPELAQKLDANAGAGFFSGDAGAGAEKLQIHFDLQEEPGLELEQGGTVLFAPLVQPMNLDPITVMDDDLFLPRLVAQRNLPDFIKQGLPKLYGKPIPKPEGAAFLDHVKDDLMPEVWDTSEDLGTVLKTSGELTQEQLILIIGQALVLISENYVHLPQKRATHAVDPVQRLKLLQYRLEQSEPGSGPTELEVHREMAATFMSLRDLHTTYRLPRPFADRVAWLPFLVEECWEHDHCHFLISKVVGTPGPATFVAGVELLHWNGTPIERVVLENGECHGGGNPAARRARGLDALTLRPLSHGILPIEDWVDLVYRDAAGKTHEFRQRWLVFSPILGDLGLNPLKGTVEATALGLDSALDTILGAKRALYGASALRKHRNSGKPRLATAVTVNNDGLETRMPSQLRPRIIRSDQGDLGYLRIFTFNVSSAEAFIDEVADLLRRMPSNGLIIDVRGNAGGLIPAAEGILQLFSQTPITPLQADIINSSTNLKLCRAHGHGQGLAGLDLSPWVASMAISLQTGATHSLSFPITPVELCNSRGRIYTGPTVLITDALCYSATDIFAASFLDHEIGQVLGIHDSTGAGGANVWSHAVLCRLGERLPTSPYRPLPSGADLRVAIRRVLRVGKNAGALLEDFGVRPTAIHHMTRRDLLESNADLIARAAKLLATSPKASVQARSDTKPA